MQIPITAKTMTYPATSMPLNTNFLVCPCISCCELCWICATLFYLCTLSSGCKVPGLYAYRLGGITNAMAHRAGQCLYINQRAINMQTTDDGTMTPTPIGPPPIPYLTMTPPTMTPTRSSSSSKTPPPDIPAPKEPSIGNAYRH